MRGAEGAGPPLWARAAFGLACVLLAALCLRESAPACTPEYGCLHDYFIRFWLIDYVDGYMRRALLGWGLGGIVGDRVPFWLLATIAAGFAALWMALSGWALKRASQGDWALVAAFLIGPPLALAREVASDPMHVVAAAFLAALLVPGRASVWIMAALSLPALAIHEASVFLMLPAAAFAGCAAYGVGLRVAPVLAGVIALAMAFALLGAETPTSPGHMVLVHGNGVEAQVQGNVLPYPGLDALSHTMKLYFGTPFQVVWTGVRAVCVLVWPLLLVALVAARTGTWTAAINFLTLLFLTGPLYVAGWDWGRFSLITLGVALALAARGINLAAAPEVAWVLRRTRLDRLATPRVPRLAPVVFALLFAPWNGYSVNALLPSNAITYLAVMGAILLLARPRPQS
tara:strand:- start:1855 stop:3057 length:1203 start_codon:yes stop_codon:yes gene_type:complete